MESLRTIIHSAQLASVIDLPVGLQNREVEIIVLPSTAATSEPVTERKTQKGCLKQYANPDLWELEKGAWGRVTVEKYLENKS
ncbi:MAG: hypothetical protein LBQ50_01180 [Planctomycetaceae bacterium]|jgi:hypothetical protein|nr:hypothetical protein [Planctomycetaceae bacterium]